MLEELKILESIIGDLSGVGLNIVFAYIAFRLVVIGAWCWAGYFVVTKVYDFFHSGVSRMEHEKALSDWKEAERLFEARDSEKAREIWNIKEDNERDVKNKTQDLEMKNEKLKMEIEKVKHMYKILKEAKEADSPKEQEV